MKYPVGRLVVPGTVLLAIGAFTPAWSAPTQAEVDQARAECHDHKVKFEARGAFATDQSRIAWEDACAQANSLMDEFYGPSPDALMAEQFREKMRGDAEAAALEDQAE